MDGVIYPLPSPFMVIATQNPVSFSGTYPLPEAQLDRFMMRLSIGYPEEEEELRMVRAHMEGRDAKGAEKILGPEDVAGLKASVSEVRISDAMLSYMQQIVAATRKDNSFALGASPRALIHLMQASRAKAFLEGRDFVKPDDIKQTSLKVLSHRLVLTTDMRLQKKEAQALLNALVHSIKIPVE